MEQRVEIVICLLRPIRLRHGRVLGEFLRQHKRRRVERRLHRRSGRGGPAVVDGRANEAADRNQGEAKNDRDIAAPICAKPASEPEELLDDEPNSHGSRQCR